MRKFEKRLDRRLQSRKKLLKGIYVIQFESGFKLGLTVNFRQRFQFYNQPWTQPIYKIWFAETEEFKKVESSLKDSYKIYSIDSTEYFDIRCLPNLLTSLDAKTKTLKLLFNPALAINELDLNIKN